MPASRSAWTTPRAPGKWSPAQEAEHVARLFDDAAKMVEGQRHGFPKTPFFLRPILRVLVLNRVLRSGTFPRSKTFKPFDPIEGPASPAAARDRLTSAHERYLSGCQRRADEDGMLTSSVFGTVPVASYMRFVTLHTRHHQRKLRQPIGA